MHGEKTAGAVRVIRGVRGRRQARRSGAGALRPARRRAPPQRRRPCADPLHPRRARARVTELRFNERRGEQVDYAIHRQERTFLPSREHCPLDPTRPGGPPTEIPFPSFEIAVFDNRFPAFQRPHGAAEVVVYTDEHDASFGTLASERAEALMWVWRHRYLQLGAREDLEDV